jgi:hypothetical protein
MVTCFQTISEIIRTFFTLIQISICLASGPKIVAEVDHDLQGSADLMRQQNNRTLYSSKR